MSQQLSPAERATSPCECVAHLLQGLTEIDPEVTVTSVDGLGAYDMIAHGAMLRGLMRVSGAALAFHAHVPRQKFRVLVGDGQWWGSQHPSWGRRAGRSHDAFVCIGSTWRFGGRQRPPHPRWMTTPTAAEVGTAHGHGRHWGTIVASTFVSGTRYGIGQANDPRSVTCLKRLPRRSIHRPRCGRGFRFPQQNKAWRWWALHSPGAWGLCGPTFGGSGGRATRPVGAHQSAWLVLLHFALARANYQLRSVPPDATADFAAVHDEGMWRCLCSILQLDPVQSDSIRETATVPLPVGGLGLRSASRTRMPAFWSRWADCSGMIRKRHPDVPARLVHHLEGHPNTTSLQAAAGAARSLRGVQGFDPPSWGTLAHGARPSATPTKRFRTWFRTRRLAARGGIHCRGIVQRREPLEPVAWCIESFNAFPRKKCRIWGGTVDMPVVSGHPFGAVFFPSLFVRLRLPLPLTGRNCRWGFPVDSSGHHHAACARDGSRRSGECCSPHLPRGLKQSHHQRCGARHGLGSPRRARYASSRSWGERTLFFLGESSWLWTSQWSVPFMHMVKDGAMLHAEMRWLWKQLVRKRSALIRSWPRTSQVGCARCRKGWPMVDWDTRSERFLTRKRVEQAWCLRLSLVMCRRTCSRHVSAGPPKLQRTWNGISDTVWMSGNWPVECWLCDALKCVDFDVLHLRVVAQNKVSQRVWRLSVVFPNTMWKRKATRSRFFERIFVLSSDLRQKSCSSIHVSHRSRCSDISGTKKVRRSVLETLTREQHITYQDFLSQHVSQNNNFSSRSVNCLLVIFYELRSPSVKIDEKFNTIGHKRLRRICHDVDSRRAWGQTHLRAPRDREVFSARARDFKHLDGWTTESDQLKKDGGAFLEIEKTRWGFRLRVHEDSKGPPLDAWVGCVSSQDNTLRCAWVQWF